MGADVFLATSAEIDDAASRWNHRDRLKRYGYIALVTVKLVTAKGSSGRVDIFGFTQNSAGVTAPTLDAAIDHGTARASAQREQASQAAICATAKAIIVLGFRVAFLASVENTVSAGLLNPEIKSTTATNFSRYFDKGRGAGFQMNFNGTIQRNFTDKLVVLRARQNAVWAVDVACGIEHRVSVNTFCSYLVNAGA